MSLKLSLGTCPTGTHTQTAPGCGFVGCVDLRRWAQTHRYRVRFEECYKAERNSHVRGDGRWYVEIPCRYGMLYPFGGTVLCAFTAARRVADRLARLPDVLPHQRGDHEQVFRFPVERLDEVAAILKPKRLSGRAVPTPDQRQSLQEGRKLRFRGGQNAA